MRPTKIAAIIVASLFLVPGSNSSAQDSCGSCEQTIPTLSSNFASAGTPSVQDREAFELWKAARRQAQLRNWTSASEWYDILASRFANTPWEARARADKGLLLKFLGDWNGAVSEFERALQLPAPQRLHHDTQTSLACIQLNRGQLDEARALIEQVRNETGSWEQKKFTASWLKAIDRLKHTRQFGLLDSCGARSMAFLLEEIGDKRDKKELSGAFSPHERSMRLSLGTMLERREG